MTGELMARSDGTCFSKCDDGKIRECEPTNPPLTLDQLMAVEPQWSPHGFEKGENRTPMHLEAIAIRESVLYAQYQNRPNRMMDRARFERRLSDRSILHSVRFGIARIFRRTALRLRSSLRDISLGCGSYLRGVFLSR